jgi:hypothetical protein
MDTEDMLIYGAIAIGAYYLYQNYAANVISPVALATMSSPTPVNVQQNEFTCPSGTVYVDSGISSSSAGGVCE